jgi:hypothetical protein
LELYRVARKLVIVIEARDSFAMKVARVIGLTSDYEVEAVSDENYRSGGVRNEPIPNFVYRWTESEVEKAVRSFEPRFVPEIRFFYGLRLPVERLRATSKPILKTAVITLSPLAKLFAKTFPGQGNEFGFVVFKGGELHPWLDRDGAGRIFTSEERVRRMGRSYVRGG